MKMKTLKKNKGFTLLEMLVSITIFSVVAVISITVVITAVDVNKKARALSTGVSDFNLVFESISRTVKSGVGPLASGSYSNTCGSTSLSSGTGDFMNVCSFAPRSNAGNFNRVPISYRHGTNPDGTGNIERRINGGEYKSITSPQLNITGLEFVVKNSFQPRVSINVSGMIRDNVDTKFNIQTTVSQRKI